MIQKVPKSCKNSKKELLQIYYHRFPIFTIYTHGIGVHDHVALYVCCNVYGKWENHILMYTNAELKISLYYRVHIKMIH